MDSGAVCKGSYVLGTACGKCARCKAEAAEYERTQCAPYANIRTVLGSLIGCKVVDVTQHDEQEFLDSGTAFVMLMFDNNQFVKFSIGDEGFEHNCDDDDTTAATST